MTLRSACLAVGLAAAMLGGAVPAAQPRAEAQELDALRDRLGAIFGNTTWRGATWGVMVRSLDNGDTLYAVEPEEPLAPASNLKLLTTAAALRILGPNYRFRTYLLTNGEVVDGVVEGDLVLYGTGDPGISDRFYRQKDEVFELLIDQLAAAGIHTVRGDLVGDASFLPGPLRPPGWHPGDLNDGFAGAVSALSFNENVVSFRVVPGAVGEAPRIFTIPDHAGLEVVNNAQTVASDARPRLAILRDEPLEPVRIEGRLLSNSRDVWREMTVPVPAHFAASVFRATLEARGVTLLGEIRTVDAREHSVVGGEISAPAFGKRGARVLARHISDPLSAHLAVVNKESNNLFAELVFRLLGRTMTGSGTPAASASAVRTALGELGVDMTNVLQLDGSGLSSGSRVSASTFADVLEHMASSSAWPEYWGSLPEAGRRGEMSRMYGTLAAGNLRAKTGTIEGVSALSGVVRTRAGERLVFSLLVNGTRSNSRAKATENEVGVLLASFDRTISTDPNVRFVEELQPDDRGPRRYLVARGESLPVIADRHGIELATLLEANPDLQAERVVAGQWLEIPARAATQ